MAAKPSSAIKRTPSGYYEDFVNEVDSDFECSICNLTLRDPVQTKCGHRFCKDCLEEHFKSTETGIVEPDNSYVNAAPFRQSRMLPSRRPNRLKKISYTCPKDGKVLDRDKEVFQDKAAKRKIASLAIKCPNEDCEWTGELNTKEIHLETCPFQAVSCTNEDCHETLKRKDLEEHVSNTCEWRIIECEYCKQLHPKCHNQDHLGKCNKFPVKCSNSCGDSIPREMIPNHIENDCTLTLVSCPYAEMGCNVKVQRKNLESHLYSATREYLDFACAKLNNTQVQLKETQILLNKTQTQMNDTQVQLGLTQEQLSNTNENLEQKVIALRRQLNLKERTDQENGNALFTWKINNFSKKWRRAQGWRRKTIKSNSFFTGRFGYRLKVLINPNEDATHLLILIVVMKSKYDAILPWPFHRKVTYTLIDQQENPELRENNVKSSFIICNRRPNKALVENVELLVSYDKLQTRRYLMGDTMFLQVDIGPPM